MTELNTLQTADKSSEATATKETKKKTDAEEAVMKLCSKGLEDYINWVIFSKIVDWNFVETHPDFPYDYHYLSQNDDLNIFFVIKHPEKAWNMLLISSHSNVKWEDIQKYDLNWDPRGVSMNPNVTLKLIKNNPEYPWEGGYISLNPNIDLQIYLTHADQLELEFEAFCQNRSLKWKTIEKNHKLFRRSPYGVSRNPNITTEIVVSNPDWGWCFGVLKDNPNINFEILRKHGYDDKHECFINSSISHDDKSKSSSNVSELRLAEDLEEDFM